MNSIFNREEPDEEPKASRLHLPRDGRGRATAVRGFSHELNTSIAEFRRLNTREARCAFADSWLAIWARDYEHTWPMVYELMKLVEEDELFRNPNMLASPDKTFETFQDYFRVRIQRPFELWAQLEQTHQTITRFAPEMIGQTFSEATKAAVVLSEHGGDRRSEKALADQGDNITLKERGTSRAYILARLHRDRPDLAARVEADELSANAAAIEAGFRRPAGVKADHTPLQDLHAAWERASPEERALFEATMERGQRLHSVDAASQRANLRALLAALGCHQRTARHYIHGDRPLPLGVAVLSRLLAAGKITMQDIKRENDNSGS